MIQELNLEVEQLLAKAETADSTPLPDGLSIPEEIARRQERKARWEQARQVMEARARERAQAEALEDEAKLDARQAKAERGEKVAGRPPEPPDPTPGPKEQYNFTDPESRILKAGNGGHFEQAYNAQAAVETESMLIVGQRVSQAPNDQEQLMPTVQSIPAENRPAGVRLGGPRVLQRERDPPRGARHRRRRHWHHRVRLPGTPESPSPRGRFGSSPGAVRPARRSKSG